ncbi:hypothetical protein Tco_0398825, partial [Tanacetum coccineum]
SVFGSKCRNEEIAESKRNECDGFDGNLSGDQFPPISAQKGNKNDVDNKDCLDNDAGGIEKGSSDCGKDDGVSEGSVSKPVNMNEIEVISIELGEDGNEVVVLNDVMIESGCEK